jgi:YihY family inner membrane protein
MFDSDLWPRLGREIKNLFPLFRYLVLQTETHAFCLALACASLLGFFPACLVMLAVLKNILHWNTAYSVVLSTVQMYFPTNQEYVVRNLEVSLAEMGRSVELSSLIWILLGAAGIFIPLEAGFNRLWQVTEDRPYWLNQIVGFSLTLLCALLAVVFISISTGVHIVADYLPFEILRKVSNYVVIRITTTCFLIVVIFAFYKLLPNKKIDSMQVLPAAILAGIMAEIVRMIFTFALPWLHVRATQGPFFVSVSFVLLAYFETFVILGGAFLASRTDRYPWMGFLRFRAQ